MIIVCTCGQKSRVRHLPDVTRIRCSKCKAMLEREATRQATRNAAIVLEATAYLLSKKSWTPEEEVLARIIHAHERSQP